MDKTEAMGFAQSLANLLQDLYRALLLQLSVAAQHGREGLSLKEFHHHEEAAVGGLAEIGVLDDVFALELGQGGRLLLKTANDLRILAQVVMDQLQGKGFAQGRMLCAVYDTAAPLTDALLEQVAFRYNGAEQWVAGHRGQ